MATRSIQSSLSLSLALQTLCCLAITSAVIYFVAYQSFEQSQRAEIVRHEAMIRTLYGQAKATGDFDGLKAELTSFFRTHDELSIQVKRNSEVIFATGPDSNAETWRRERLSGAPETPELELLMGVDVKSDRTVLKTLAIALVMVSLAASLVMSMMGARLVRRGLTPLRSLAKETREVGPHASGKRLDEDAYGAEMESFVHQFNLMLERAEQAYQQLEAFNADVAHELRTPLANLIGEAEVELGQPRNAEELREVLLSNVEEARRLAAMVTDMLFLSRADRGVTARTVHVASLVGPVQDVVEFHEAILESKGLTVDVAGESSAEADLGLVKRALSNLLGNAVQYATPGSAIRIDVACRQEAIWFEVSNDGPSIPHGTEERLFERFYRVDRSRTGANYGLGLAIVAAIARMHGGQTKASSHGGKTTVAFSISAKELR